MSKKKNSGNLKSDLKCPVQQFDVGLNLREAAIFEIRVAGWLIDWRTDWLTDKLSI